MKTVYTLQQNFAGGEITPEMLGAVSLRPRETGLAKCYNAEVTPIGSVRGRSGFRMMEPGLMFAHSATDMVQYIPYVRSTDGLTMYIVRITSHGLYAFDPSGKYIPAASYEITSGINVSGGSATVTVNQTAASPTPSTQVRINQSTPDGNMHHGAAERWYFGVPDGGSTGAYIYKLENPAATGVAPVFSTTPSIGGLATLSFFEPCVAFPETLSDDNFRYVQRGDDLYLTHYPATTPDNEVIKLTPTDSTYSTFTATYVKLGDPPFLPPQLPGSGAQPILTAAPTSATPGNPVNQTYSATALDADGKESEINPTYVTVANDLTLAGNYNTLTLVTSDALHNPDGSLSTDTLVKFRIYKNLGGMMGYIGEAYYGNAGSSTTEFYDNNIVPDTTLTPPVYQAPFTIAPFAALAPYQQRMMYAGTGKEGLTIGFSRTGQSDYFGKSSPIQYDDSLVVTLDSNTREHAIDIISRESLIMLTDKSEWVIGGSNSGAAISPANIQGRRVSHTGSNGLPPLVFGNDILFVDNVRQHIQRLMYSWAANSYITEDVSTYAPHLVDGYYISRSTYVKGKIPVVWAARATDSGLTTNGTTLLGCTYDSQQRLLAWHQHQIARYAGDTTFADIAGLGSGLGPDHIASGTSVGRRESLFAAVSITPGGSGTTTMLTLVTQAPNGLDMEYAGPKVFLDHAFVQSVFEGNVSATFSTVEGLYWWEGQTVAVCADGADTGDQVVTKGTVTVPTGTAEAVVGIRYTPTLNTLPLVFEAPEAGASRTKNAEKIYVRLYKTVGFFVGPLGGTLNEYKLRSTEPYGSPPAEKTSEVSMVLSPSWGNEGAISIENRYATPMEILNIALETTINVP